MWHTRSGLNSVIEINLELGFGQRYALVFNCKLLKIAVKVAGWGTIITEAAFFLQKLRFGIIFIGYLQTTLSWSVGSRGILYADGVNIANTSGSTVETSTLIPCRTLVLAFSLWGDGADKGLLGSFDSEWSSGKEGIVCTSDVTEVSTDDWKYYGKNEFSQKLIRVHRCSCGLC